MIKRLFSSQTKTIAGAAIILGIASFFSRLIGIIRDRIFAHIFGADAALDAYYAAFRVPDFIYNLLIVGALSAGFIPLFLELYQKNKTDAWRFTQTMLKIVFAALIVIAGILFFIMPRLIETMLPGMDPATSETTILLSRIMLISPILLGLSSVIGSVLQAMKSFLLYSLTPILYNLGIIIGAVFLVPHFGITGLAYGVILGAFLHLAIQLPSLFHLGYKTTTPLPISHPAMKKIGKLMIPRTIGLASNQITLVALTSVASTLGPGSITVYNFANNLQYFPIGIIGISFALAAFPALSEQSAPEQREAFVETLAGTIRQILFFILPITIIFLLLRAQIVRVLLGSGAFDWSDTIRTADMLALFSLSLFAQCLIPLLARAFYALQNTSIPTIASIIATVITIIGSVITKQQYGMTGLAFAFTVGSIAQLLILWIALRYTIKTLREDMLIHFLLKISIAIALMAIAIQGLKGPISVLVDMTTFVGIFTQGCITGIAGLLMYWLVCTVLRVEEIKMFEDTITRRYKQIKQMIGRIQESTGGQ